MVRYIKLVILSLISVAILCSCNQREEDNVRTTSTEAVEESSTEMESAEAQSTETSMEASTEDEAEVSTELPTEEATQATEVPMEESTVEETEAPIEEGLNTAIRYWNTMHFKTTITESDNEDIFIRYYKYGYITYLVEPKYIAEDGGVRRSEIALTLGEPELVTLKSGEIRLIAGWNEDGELLGNVTYQTEMGNSGQAFAADSEHGIIQIGDTAYNVHHEKIFSTWIDSYSVGSRHFYIMDVDTTDEHVEFIYEIDAKAQEMSMVMRYNSETGLLTQLGVLPYKIEGCDGAGTFWVTEEFATFEADREYINLQIKDGRIIHEPQDIFYVKQVVLEGLNRHETEEHDLQTVVEMKLYADPSCEGDYVILQPQQVDVLSTDLEIYLEVHGLLDDVTGYVKIENFKTPGAISGSYAPG